MATQKKNIKTTSANDIAPTPPSSFSLSVEAAIQDAFKDAPEFKSALEPELKVLCKTLNSIHNDFLQRELMAQEQIINDLNQDLKLAMSDVEVLKTTVLRMAVGQFGH